MANIHEVLKKNKKKVKKIQAERKKIKRQGATRPWQENLEKFQSESKATSSSGDKDDNIKSMPSPAASNDSIEAASHPLPKDIPSLKKTSQKPNIKASKSRHKSDTSKTQLQHNTNTNKQHITDTALSTQSKEIPTQITELPITNYYTNTDTMPTQKSDGGSEDIEKTNFIDPTQDITPTQINNTKPTRAESGIPTQEFTSPSDSIDQHDTDTNTAPFKSNTMPTQIGDTNPTQTDTKPTRSALSIEARGHNPNTKPTPQSTQFSHENEDPLVFSQLQKDIATLQGNKLTLAYYIARYLIDTNQNMFITSYDVLALNAEISTGSIRTTMKRLKKNGLLEIESLGKGRGARIQISMPEITLKAFTKALFATQHIPTLQQHKADTTIDTNGSSKLVTNKKETNLTKDKNFYYDLYKNVDFTPTETNSILSNNRLSREKIISEIGKNGWDIKPFELEETLSKFARYVSDQNNIYNVRSIQGFFFSQMKKLSNGELLDIEAVESETDQALLMVKQKMLAKKAQREQMKQEIMDLAFDEWWELSSHTERESLAPGVFKISSDQEVIKRGVRGAWETEIWPKTPEYDELAQNLKGSSNRIWEEKSEVEEELVEKTNKVGENTIHE